MNEQLPIDQVRFSEIIKDAVAQKRVIKWGYVRQFGGLYAADCDSVAAHSSAVAVLATILAHEYAIDIEEATGIRLNLSDITLLATFHDLGEGRSGDTGASSYSVRGVCNLYSLEREGLVASLRGLKIEQRVLTLFDEYRCYKTPESIMVHLADNLEGFEKAAHACARQGQILEDAIYIVNGNIQIYRRTADTDPRLGKFCAYAVDRILTPGIAAICDGYRLGEELRKALQLSCTEQVSGIPAG